MTHHTNDIRISDMPGTAREMVRLMGQSGAVSLILAYPGWRFHVPVRIDTDSGNFRKVADVAGLAGARALFKWMAGTAFKVPSCRTAITRARNRRICADFDAGASVADLVGRYGLSRRTIFNALKGLGNGQTV